MGYPPQPTSETQLGPVASTNDNVAQSTIGVKADEPRYLKTAEEMELEEPGVHGDTAWMSREDANYLGQLAKAGNVSIEVVDTLGQAQGTYDPRTGRIRIARDATDPVGFVTQHELTHRMKQNSPEKWSQFLGYVQERYGESWSDVVEQTQQRYAESGIELTAEEAAEEVAADFAGNMDEKEIRRLTQENRSLAEKILDAIRSLIRKLKGGENQRLYEMEKLWADALKEGNKNTANEGGVKNSIKTLEDGKRYVKADRQVIFGNDPQSWSEQLENYINSKIRRGQDVTLIGADGDELLLTATSAGKLSDNHTSDGRTMSDTAYERKTNAAAHIDELAQISTRGDKTVKDADGRHGSMASKGWNYRTAYFEDFDGKYYEVKVSTAKSDNGTMLYNIGQMQERSSPKINGSSAANSGALRGEASSKNSIRSSDAKSNTQNAEKKKFSLKDSKGRKLTETQGKYFGESQVRDKSGNLLPVYHTTYDAFTTFDRGKLGAITDGNATDETVAATAHIGFWFNTQDLREAYGSGSRTEEVYLNIENPLKLGSLDDLYNYVALYGGDGSATEMGEAVANALRESGYDGIVLRDTEFGGTSYVALEPELAQGFRETVKEQRAENVYAYCASCAGCLSRGGVENIHHVLAEILETGERPVTSGASLWNRAKRVF